MDINTVKSQIVHNEIENFYIFTGEEVEVLNRYVKKIAEVSGKSLQQVDCVADCFKRRGMTLLKQSFCYVCRDDKDFIKADNAKYWDNFLLPFGSMLDNNILILVYTDLDKRGKFYKAMAEKITTFDHLNNAVLEMYLDRDLGLNKDDSDELIDACESDYSRILLESDKIKTYADAKEISIQDSLYDLIDSGAIHKDAKDAVFDWVDAILEDKPRRAFRLLDECLEFGEVPLRLLSLLYNNIKWVLQVQSCESSNVSAATGLSDWQIRKARGKSGIYHNYELIDAMKSIQRAEMGIKQGTMDESMAVPYVMINLLRVKE